MLRLSEANTKTGWCYPLDARAGGGGVGGRIYVFLPLIIVRVKFLVSVGPEVTFMAVP